jgi:sRNA-binding regulator protein Hfq
MENVPVTEKQSIHNPYSEQYLLTRTFQTDRSLVRLITYDGIRDERVRKITQYNFLLADASPLPKLEVLLAFSVENARHFSPYLQIYEGVKDLGLKSVKKIAERRFVDMQVAVGDAVAITLRNGIAIRGICQAFSKYNMVLDIRGELLLVYKHGVYTFEKNPY